VTKVFADITMSLDGFITEPNEPVGNTLGDDPMPMQRKLRA
jgi:hypothetical protein